MVAWLNLDAEDDHLRRFCSYLAASLARAEPMLRRSLRHCCRRARSPTRRRWSARSWEISTAPVARSGWCSTASSRSGHRRSTSSSPSCCTLRRKPARGHRCACGAGFPSRRTGDAQPGAGPRPAGPVVLARRDPPPRRATRPSVVTNAMVARLHRATRGWPAGLQLAVAALNGGIPLERYLAGPGRAQPGQRGAAGRDCDRQPAGGRPAPAGKHGRAAAIQCGAVSAIVGRELPPGTLERIRASQPFVQALDMDGGWYAYHPIFHDWLMRRLEAWPTDKVMEIHRRAAAVVRRARSRAGSRAAGVGQRRHRHRRGLPGGSRRRHAATAGRSEHPSHVARPAPRDLLTRSPSSASG